MREAVTRCSVKRILRERDMIDLSQRDRKAFVESLLNPPRPNQHLREAARRYVRVVGSNEQLRGISIEMPVVVKNRM